MDFAIPSGINMFVIYDTSYRFWNIYNLEKWDSNGAIKQVFIKSENEINDTLDNFSQFLDELKAEGRIS